MTKGLYQVIQNEGAIWIGENKVDVTGIPIVQGLFKLEMFHMYKDRKERLLFEKAQRLVNLANETLLLRKQSHE